MWLFSNSLQNYYIKLPKHVSEIKKMQKKCFFGQILALVEFFSTN